ASGVSTGVAIPPAWGMRNSPPLDVPKMITPLRFHEPPAPEVPGTSQSDCAGPPEASIFFSLSFTKKPMKRLSGDQKGYLAPSVPGNSCAERESSERTHSDVRPSIAVAMNARRWPSG